MKEKKLYYIILYYIKLLHKKQSIKQLFKLKNMKQS